MAKTTRDARYISGSNESLRCVRYGYSLILGAYGTHILGKGRS